MNVAGNIYYKYYAVVLLAPMDYVTKLLKRMLNRITQYTNDCYCDSIQLPVGF